MHLELISFPICPYVQRSVITLLHKKVPFDLKYIDLAKKPDWFLALSPLGKVPILRVDNESVLFESAVINEFIDETHPPRMLPEDAISRARSRGWIEFGGSAFMALFNMMVGATEESVLSAEKSLLDLLGRVERELGEGPYFSGKDFSLVDSTFAPLFMRLEIINRYRAMPSLRELPKVTRWSEALLAYDPVKKSVRSGFEEELVRFAQAKGSLIFRQQG